MSKRLNMRESAQCAYMYDKPLTGYITESELDELTKEKLINAIVTAYAAGYHRGAVAALEGKYDPVEARKNQLKKKREREKREREKQAVQRETEVLQWQV